MTSCNLKQQDLDRQRLGGFSKHRALPMGSSQGNRECTILGELQVVPYGIYKECPKVISSLTTTYNGDYFVLKTNRMANTGLFIFRFQYSGHES